MHISKEDRKKMSEFYELNCPHCGFEAWSLLEVTKCRKCGTIVDCSKPGESVPVEVTGESGASVVIAMKSSMAG